MSQKIFLTTTIPYVNAAPHLGFTLEAVQADVLARHHRARGDQVRLLSGTDDNSLKNVIAAEAAGIPVRALVDHNAEAFADLGRAFELSYDDFIRTSSDPRHVVGVTALWRACAANGDLYQARYDGLYCVGCEHYLTPDELVDGECPEHNVPPQHLTEENWFFRLSRYAEPLRAAIESGQIRIEPAGRRNEVLGFIAGGLRDFSISRSFERARGWGITVPGHAGQVIYVWWDALGNYLTSLGFGGADHAYQDWWVNGDRRIHLLGKGVLRFHAVYWPAMLLSAGLPLPTNLLVHDYLTANGEKISKSTGNHVDPIDLAQRYSVDAVRWWLLRDVPRVGDADFTEARLIARANLDLAGGFGNLVNRVVTMIHRYLDGKPPAPVGRAEPTAEIAEALADFEFRRATAAVLGIVERANAYVEATRPWQLAKQGATAELEQALADLLARCQALGEALQPFLPNAAARILTQITPVDGVLPPPTPLFPRY